MDRVARRPKWPKNPPAKALLEEALEELYGPGADFRLLWSADDPQAEPARTKRARERERGERLTADLAKGLLETTDRFQTSRTNSGPLLLAVGYVAPADCRGVGIDTEPQARRLSPAALERIQGPWESTLPIPGIALWAIKEACFKANPANVGTVLPQYRVTAWFPALGPGAPAEGLARYERSGQPVMVFRFLVLESSGWVIALARASLPATRPGGVS